MTVAFVFLPLTPPVVASYEENYWLGVNSEAATWDRAAICYAYEVDFGPLELF